MEKLNNSINLFLSGKGGIGKSTAASLLMEYMQKINNGNVQGYDLDAENKTLSQYNLPVEECDVFTSDKLNVDFGKVNSFFERVLANNNPRVIDCSALVYRPMLKFLRDENKIYQSAKENGTSIYVHCLFSHFSAHDTVNVFKTMADAFKNTGIKFVLWFNETEGKVMLDGTPVIDHPIFFEHESQIAGGVIIPTVNVRAQLDEVNW